MLLLDEPNNYLDIISIRWLEKFLIAWPGELMLITHDRSFMDKVVTHTMAIHRRKVNKIEGDTGKLYDQIALEEETYEKTRVNDERKRRKSRTSSPSSGPAPSSRPGRIAEEDAGQDGEEGKLESHQIARIRFRLQNVSREIRPERRRPDLRLRSRPAPDPRFRAEHRRPGPGLRHRPERQGQDDPSQAPGRGPRAPNRAPSTQPPSVAPGYFEQTNVRPSSDNTVLEEIASADAERPQRPGSSPA